MKTRFTVEAGWMQPWRAVAGNRRGVTLVELVLLLAIAAIVIPGLMVYFTEAMEHSTEAQLQTMGAGLAQELMEEIKAKRWDENVPIPPGVATAANALGPEAGETQCNPATPGCKAYNDIDDYNGLPTGPPTDSQGNALPSTYSAFREQVSVCYAAEVQASVANQNAGSCVTTPTDYKMITVTVTWGLFGRVQLQSVVANYAVKVS